MGEVWGSAWVLSYDMGLRDGKAMGIKTGRFRHPKTIGCATRRRGGVVSERDEVFFVCC